MENAHEPQHVRASLQVRAVTVAGEGDGGCVRGEDAGDLSRSGGCFTKPSSLSHLLAASSGGTLALLFSFDVHWPFYSVCVTGTRNQILSRRGDARGLLLRRKTEGPMSQALLCLSSHPRCLPAAARLEMNSHRQWRPLTHHCCCYYYY